MYICTCQPIVIESSLVSLGWGRCFLITAVRCIENNRYRMVIIDVMLEMKQFIDWLRGCRLSYIHKHSGWWR